MSKIERAVWIVFAAALSIAIGFHVYNSTPAAPSTPVHFNASSGPSPVIPASWRVANWYLDPQDTSGTAVPGNNCTTSATACLTYGEIQQQLGTTSPQLQQVTTTHLLSAQTAGVDSIFRTSQLANGAQDILIGTPLIVAGSGSPFVGGAVTAKVRGGPGTLLQVATMPATAAAKQLVFNSTRNSYAFIDSMSGSTATMTQPIPASVINTVGIPSLSEDNTWATGDTLNTYTLPLANVKSWNPTSGDLGSAAVTSASVGWMQWVNVPDTSGAGTSNYPLISNGQPNIMSSCLVSGRLSTASNVERGPAGAIVIGTDVTGLVQAMSGVTEVYGGIIRTTGSGFFGPLTFLDGDTIILGTWSTYGTINAGSVYGTGTAEVRAGQSWVQNISGSAIWGSMNFTLTPGALYQNVNGTTFVNTFLVSGQITFNLSVGTGYTPTNCGTFTLNGTTAVNVAGTFPAVSVIAWSLNTIGSTPGTGSPYFATTAIQANQFTVKSPTPSANDVYNWCASPVSVALTAANMDLYGNLNDPNTRAIFTNGLN